MPDPLCSYSPNRYSPPHFNYTIRQQAPPRTNHTFRVLAASTALGLTPSVRRGIHHYQNQNQPHLVTHNFSKLQLPGVLACRKWNSASFKYALNYETHKNNTLFRQQLLDLYPYYACPGFVDLIKTFPEYEHHVLHAAQCTRERNRWTLYTKWHGVRDTIGHLEQEIVQARHQQRKLALAQQQHEALRQQQECAKVTALQAQITSQSDTLATLYGDYQQQVETDLVSLHQAQRAANGLPLLNAKSSSSFYNKQYQLNKQVQQLLIDHGVESDALVELSSCFGNKIQQAAHQEFIDILKTLADKKRRTVLDDLDKLAVNLSIIGIQANKAGKITQAYVLSDCCWAVLDFTMGAAEGLIEGTKQTAATFLHPIDTATNLGKGLGSLVYHIGKVAYELGDIGITSYLNPQEGRTKWENYVDRTGALCSALKQKIRSIPPRDLVRTGVAFTTETFLTGKCLGAMHTFAHASHRKALDLARRAQAGEMIATTAEGFQVRIANNAAKTFSKMERAGEKIAGVAQKIIPKVANMKEFFELEFGTKIKHLCQKTNLQFKGQTIYKVTEKTNNKYLKQGYHFYLDSLHFDHIEVFGKNGNLKAVLNLDGTYNAMKTGKAYGRSIGKL